MATKKWAEIKAKRFTPEQIEASRDAAREEVLRMSLREIRKMSGKTQTAVAKAMHIAQSEISEIERRADTRVSTFRKYARACGGVAELVVRFPGHKAVIVEL